MWIKALLPDLHCWPRSINEVIVEESRCGLKLVKVGHKRKAEKVKEPEAEAKVTTARNLRKDSYDIAR